VLAVLQSLFGPDASKQPLVLLQLHFLHVLQAQCRPAISSHCTAASTLALPLAAQFGWAHMCCLHSNQRLLVMCCM
jgi:hypothetical protein